MDQVGGLGRGLIPARAGNTWRFAARGCRPGAHPRSRGEHSDSAGELHGVRGSSPLARGTRDFIKIHRDVAGLIPARAGNTLAGKSST